MSRAFGFCLFFLFSFQAADIPFDLTNHAVQKKCCCASASCRCKHLNKMCPLQAKQTVSPHCPIKKTAKEITAAELPAGARLLKALGCGTPEERARIESRSKEFFFETSLLAPRHLKKQTFLPSAPPFPRFLQDKRFEKPPSPAAFPF